MKAWNLGLRRGLPWLIVGALALYFGSPSAPQPGKQPPAEKTTVPSSYDQVTPVLLGHESFQTMMAKDKAAKAGVMARQQKLLAERYDLARKVDSQVTMTRGKPIPVG